MAQLSGTFSSPYPGRLQITLSGVFYQGVGRDAGFPSGSSDLLIAPQVNGNTGPAISRDVAGTYFELDYPGGSASWNVSTILVNHSSSGTAAYGFSSLSMIIQLMKR